MTTRFNRWGWVAIVAVLATGILVAIAGGRGSAQRALAADPTDDAITVTGVGAAQGIPDTLTASFRVVVRRATVQQALNAQSRYANQLLSALKDDGLKDEDISTTDVELFRYHNRKTGVSGYYASESWEARITPIDDAGKVISDAAASSSHVNIDGLSFDIKDNSDLITQARDAAFADAKDRASQYAALSNRSLGRVEHVTEKVDFNEPVYARAASAGGTSGAPSSVTLSPGQQTLTIRVTVIWQLT
jgi:uncharacterized protein